ncbi:zinc ribbon domain-containing protein [Ruania rhizosphaerae]|uniref:zinc ribbon domain-containing protein n=1 Tax=Ruania rhizosphaerae TaxID=1840413 RepID=UPI00135A9FE6|nr:zinc ribbon domain-containing protein [Ruania rhizosphaerae]
MTESQAGAGRLDRDTAICPHFRTLMHSKEYDFVGYCDSTGDESAGNMPGSVGERGYARERRKRHDHYLKGTIWCGQCRLEQHVNRRMILMRTTGRHGNADYGYFFCRGVQDRVCDAPYSSIERVEDAVAEHYKTIRLSPAFVAAVRSHIESALNDQVAAQQLLRKNLEDQLTQLTTKEDNLLDLAADGSLPQDRIRHGVYQGCWTVLMREDRGHGRYIQAPVQCAVQGRGGAVGHPV